MVRTPIPILALLLACIQSGRAADTPLPAQWIGYTELRTSLPGGRHANVRTMRAALVKADGTGRRLLADELANEADAWTQFAGWSPTDPWRSSDADGKAPTMPVGRKTTSSSASPPEAGRTTRTS